MSKKILVYVLISLNVLLESSCSAAIDLPEAKLTIKVVTEDGKPIEGANIAIGFEVPKENGRGVKSAILKAVTDAHGLITVSNKTLGYIGYEAAKEGYYKSDGKYSFGSNKNGYWQPRNPELTVVLRKIENPIPMYARNAHAFPITVPELRKSVGFDLIEFDWVSPYGKGKRADFLFKLTSTYNSEVDFDTKLELTFPNKFDGIQLIKEDRTVGSALKLPRMAPETGYQNKLVRSRSRVPGTPGENDQKEDNNYIFRIRSEEENGKLVRAMYGKIHGDIYVHPPTSIYFKYYLNPDYTRNLEFNPKKNLFENIPRGERIGLD